MSVKEPLSTVQLDPISTPSSKITLPICGVLRFFCLIGIKPKPLVPIFEPSFMCTLEPINEFLITINDPITQFSPILTLLSIIVLLDI